VALAFNPAPQALAIPVQSTFALTAPRYKLGPGDRLAVKLFQVEGFDSNVAVLPDGTVNLPRIGSQQVWGLTLDQAREQITGAYKKVLRRPVVYLDLVATRPLRVSVTGEVQRPGLYAIGLKEVNQLANTDGGESSTVTSQGWPTLVEAIQKAGGLTARGDLRRVTLVRPVGGVGRTQTIEVNYWEALRNGAPVNNPLIYDGDSVRIPVAESQEQDELLTVASSSFAPSSITVQVVGEVIRPGPQKVRANSPLSQALQAAGGISLRGNQNTIELLRLEPNGTVERRVLSYRPASNLGDTSNPPLRDGDVVVVDRHGWAKTNDRLKAAVEPLGPLLNAASIFRLLGTGF
jgi:polysaccharide biosynthesis/export protein